MLVLRFRHIAGLALLIGAAVVAGCSQTDAPARQADVRDVGVYVVTPQRYTVRETLPGRTRATQQSEVRPQVEGIIEKRLFTEGADVAAGDVLYRIDPARYSAAVDEAEAQLAQARARLQSDAPLAKRYTELAKIDAISKQDRDNAVATLAQDKADVASAKASLKTARINLGYTRIKAPIAGRIGASTVTAGALVTTNQSEALTTITQLDPIYVDIQQSATQYLALKQAIDSGRLATDDNDAAPVRVTPEGSDLQLDGKLAFSGVTVDSDTGAVMLRAIVPNPAHDLLPGMYVRATLTQGIDVRALLVPQQAVSRNGKGEPSAFVIDADDTVEKKALTIAGATDDHRWRVTDGLTAGDRVVVQGAGQIQVGDRVTTTPLVVRDGNLQPAPATNTTSNGPDTTPPDAG
ncbi:efflux RND transporter periplasmic adaptor subunit [Salinisphaera sp. Q1T1-3]|uniref:efflux RND transporter periplasmic adaptor subunit n=1 Tax=Salinisphaera sp. Q1T1-3 TaxID=2321229 RepID=UPI000E737C5F|nr:efflux RND transporter periplasmic adaptor subunit [Salinisphaera sp. Q1T1-3]RJS91603.1 efflux RND transporter periplasmic adaptor subunit [Salinisphaera sp. Q1T1-3]